MGEEAGFETVEDGHVEAVPPVRAEGRLEEQRAVSDVRVGAEPDVLPAASQLQQPLLHAGPCDNVLGGVRLDLGVVPAEVV